MVFSFSRRSERVARSNSLKWGANGSMLVAEAEADSIIEQTKKKVNVGDREQGKVRNCLLVN